jgi:hypothetical protein
MKKLLTEWRKFLNEIKLDIKVGDVLLGGKFKNKRVIVKSIGKDALGQPTINGQSLLKFRIEKNLPDSKKSKKTLEAGNKDES